MTHALERYLRDIGALRASLFAVVVVLIVAAPFAGGPVDTSGLGLLSTVVAPAFYVMVVFVLPLDMVMSRVFMSDKSGPERQRFRRIIASEAILLAVLLASWGPFVARLVGLA